MFQAVNDCHLNCLKAAIASGANVSKYDEPTGERKDVLEAYSSSSVGVEILRLLQNVDADENSPPQKTALIRATETGLSAGVELLIKSGAYVNKADTLGRSPLMVAAENGQGQLVEQLIQAGANVNMKLKTDSL